MADAITGVFEKMELKSATEEFIGFPVILTQGSQAVIMICGSYATTPLYISPIFLYIYIITVNFSPRFRWNKTKFKPLIFDDLSDFLTKFQLISLSFSLSTFLSTTNKKYFLVERFPPYFVIKLSEIADPFFLKKTFLIALKVRRKFMRIREQQVQIILWFR